MATTMDETNASHTLPTMHNASPKSDSHNLAIVETAGVQKASQSSHSCYYCNINLEKESTQSSHSIQTTPATETQASPWKKAAPVYVCEESIQPVRPRQWRSTILRFGPISGLFAMVVALSSIVISLGILVASDGAPKATWAAEPSIYLAICTAIANLSVRYACINGVAIAWWIRALKGSTLSKLHHDWRSGTTLRGALTAGRSNIGLLGVATIFSTLVVMDGPLLQKATTVVSAPFYNQKVPLNIAMLPEIPTDSTGSWLTMEEYGYNAYYNLMFNATQPGGDNTPVPNNIYTSLHVGDVGKLYYSEALLHNVVKGCKNSKCNAVIRAPALAVTSCRSWEIPANYSAVGKNALVAALPRAPPLEYNLFFVATSLVLDEYESINVIAGHAETDLDCSGVLRYTSCDLQPAIGEYNVSIEDDTIDPRLLPTPKILALANNTAVRYAIDPVRKMHLSTLGGLVECYWTKWNSYVTSTKVMGGTAIGEVNEMAVLAYETPVGENCYSFSDPMPDLIASYNRLMFTAGSVLNHDRQYLESKLDAGWADYVNTTVLGHLAGDHNVFQTDYWWYFAAALVEVVCICLIAPTYWGWWHLGRPVSFSPLEIAKAFEAPMFADCNSNSSGRDLAKSLDGVKVRYGSSEGTNDGAGEKTRLAFGCPDAVHRPVRGTTFST